jgi:hypothetical protein
VNELWTARRLFLFSWLTFRLPAGKVVTCFGDGYVYGDTTATFFFFYDTQREFQVRRMKGSE